MAGQTSIGARSSRGLGVIPQSCSLCIPPGRSLEHPGDWVPR